VGTRKKREKRENEENIPSPLFPRAAWKHNTKRASVTSEKQATQKEILHNTFIA